MAATAKGFVAIERRDRRMLAFLTHLYQRGAPITVPTCVVGEWWWRGRRGPAARRGDLVLTGDLADLARICDAAFPGVLLRRA